MRVTSVQTQTSWTWMKLSLPLTRTTNQTFSKACIVSETWRCHRLRTGELTGSVFVLIFQFQDQGSDSGWWRSYTPTLAASISGIRVNKELSVPPLTALRLKERSFGSIKYLNRPSSTLYCTQVFPVRAHPGGEGIPLRVRGQTLSGFTQLMALNPSYHLEWSLIFSSHICFISSRWELGRNLSLSHGSPVRRLKQSQRSIW